MDEQKQKVIDSIKQANNILITVRNSPSIDQLAACIALTLVVNDLGKHGTAVFSGHVPSTLEFLDPDKTLERNTDSLRDFIISLDKAKADKLRYKVEDTVVKVFITPYRTSLSPNDLEFSQGDFNVDVVIALGVHTQNDLDEAITAHGRILHDATVISLNTEGGGAEDLGSINWIDPNFSSLSEMVYGFADKLGKEDVVDNQVATALLTGIVAETGRFGNSKTKPQTMEVAAKLLGAGANQELVAAKLSEPEKPEEPEQPADSGQNGDGNNTPPQEPPVDTSKGGELDIEHQAASAEHQLPQPTEDHGANFAQENTQFAVNNDTPTDHHPEDRPSGEPTASTDQPAIIDLNQPESSGGEERDALDFLKEHKVTDAGRNRLEPLHKADEVLDAPKIIREMSRSQAEEPGSNTSDVLGSRLVLTPPSMGGTLTANMPGDSSGASPLNVQNSNAPILTHENAGNKLSSSQESDHPMLDAAPLPLPSPIEPVEQPAKQEEQPHYTTLEELEKQVHAHAANDAPHNAQDMPVPTAIQLPSPQTISPSNSPSVGPLSPPPPVPPPLPSL